MKTKPLVLMAVALGCGLVAMLGVKQHLSNKSAAPEETVDVLVATMDIEPGKWLDETNSEFRAFPKSALVEGVVLEREVADERALLTSVFSGDFIVERKLGPKGERGISTVIPAGMRLVSIPVDATMTHSGLMMPGNHVDVMCTYKKKNQTGGQTPDTQTVLSYVEVFATDNINKTKAHEGSEILSKNVSLLVNEEHSKMLLAAKELGTLHLALRSGADKAAEEENTDLTDFQKQLIGQREPIDEADNTEDIEAALYNELIGGNEPAVSTPADVAVTNETHTEAVVVKKSDAPLWDIVIYEGDQKRIESVELPVKPDPSPAEQLFNAIRENGAIPALINSYF